VVSKDASGHVTQDVRYTYDVDDQRIGKAVDANGDGQVDKGEQYVYAGGQLALVISGGVQERYLYGPGVDQPLAVESFGSVHWLLADDQGTVRDVVDGAGAVIDHLVVDAFEAVVSQTHPGAAPRFIYTGREYDPETGLYQYRERYYDPAVGRFLSADPSGFAAGDPNLYRYVGNAAPNARDPSGLQPILPTEEVGVQGEADSQALPPPDWWWSQGLAAPSELWYGSFADASVSPPASAAYANLDLISWDPSLLGTAYLEYQSAALADAGIPWDGLTHSSLAEAWTEYRYRYFLDWGGEPDPEHSARMQDWLTERYGRYGSSLQEGSLDGDDPIYEIARQDAAYRREFFQQTQFQAVARQVIVDDVSAVYMPAGVARLGIEAVGGFNLGTGEDLSAWGRTWRGTLAAVPLVPAAWRAIRTGPVAPNSIGSPGNPAGAWNALSFERFIPNIKEVFRFDWRTPAWSSFRPAGDAADGILYIILNRHRQLRLPGGRRLFPQRGRDGNPPGPQPGARPAWRVLLRRPARRRAAPRGARPAPHCLRRGRRPAQRRAGHRTRPRQPDAGAGRLARLHPGRRLPGHRLVHLPGQRRRLAE
jgi:RHS repeat-associated protein